MILCIWYVRVCFFMGRGAVTVSVRQPSRTSARVVARMYTNVHTFKQLASGWREQNDSC